MAYYAALVSLVQLLEDIFRHDQYPNFLHHKQQIASLYEKFSLLQASLKDCYSPKDEGCAADCLERQIRDAACQAQDIIEYQISNQINPQKDKTYGVKRVFQPLISAFQKAMYSRVQDLKKVEEEVDSIVAELMKIKKSRTTEDFQLNYFYSADTGASKQASSGRNTMVGFDEDLTTIKAQLCGESSKLQVVSVVGMGGMGKTTLAKNIFEDELILYHFYCRAWVTVSQDYHLRIILLDILNSMNINKVLSKEEEDHVLAEYIYKHLKGRRYLIIIDDIWDTKVWDDVNRIFPDDCNGSRIILTTRLLDVAVYADSCGFLHQMQFLDEDESWNLFCEKVFCPSELEDIGRQISNCCQGLPLAIVVVAGLLSKVNKARYDWDEIARNLSSAASENDEHLSKILSLSYDHLPHHLKPCFLHMGGFPEDSEIRVSKLVKIWVAEGFLKPINSKNLEEIAEEYLEDLVSRSLVLSTKRRYNGKLKHCSIHDVLRDLCINRAHHENFLHVLDKKNYSYSEAIRNGHRLYIHRARSQITETEECDSHVRSILYFGNNRKLLSFASAGCKLLRVLDIPEIILLLFPDEILELSHLRYLALQGEAGFNLPPSMSKLQNLQTLIVRTPWVVFTQGFDISLLSNLRHVMVGNLTLPPIPSAILENLHTLAKVSNAKFTTKIIEMIPNIKKLKVSYHYYTCQRWQNCGLNNLIHLGQLESLVVWFPLVALSDPEPFPESFAFPQMLKKLSLKGCRLPWKDMTVVGSLPNLEVLELRNDAFTGELWDPLEEEFPQLKILRMRSLSLKYWRAEDYHFPKLQHLEIISCGNLVEIPPRIGDISTLELIEVHYSELAAGSAVKLQEEQRDLGNDGLQVRIFPQD